MKLTKVFRIKNIKTGKYHKSYNGLTMWARSHCGINSFKQKNNKVHPDDHPDWELKEYKLVEI